MKRILLATALSIVSLTQVMADTFEIVSVTDDTPDQSYRNAGGYLSVLFVGQTARGGSSSIDKTFQDPQRKKPGFRVDYDFGNNINWKPTIYQGDTKFAIEIFGDRDLIKQEYGQTIAEKTWKATNEHHKIHIAITKYTPGPAGTKGEGTITVSISEEK